MTTGIHAFLISRLACCNMCCWSLALGDECNFLKTTSLWSSLPSGWHISSLHFLITFKFASEYLLQFSEFKTVGIQKFLYQTLNLNCSVVMLCSNSWNGIGRSYGKKNTQMWRCWMVLWLNPYLKFPDLQNGIGSRLTFATCECYKKSVAVRENPLKTLIFGEVQLNWQGSKTKRKVMKKDFSCQVLSWSVKLSLKPSIINPLSAEL